jgi:hypothetical protein
MIRITDSQTQYGVKEAQWGLTSLAYFLNLDLDTVKEEAFKEHFFLRVYLSSLLQRPKGRRAAKRLQADVRDHLLLLVGPKRQLSLEEAYELLWGLVERVNKVLHTPRWAILPVDYELYADDAGKTVTGSHRLEAEEREEQSNYLRPGQRVIQLLGYRWRVGLDYGGVGSLQGYVYSLIIHALEDAKLTQLKVCNKCQKFFAQADARQRFCSDQCRIESNNKRRLESGYFSALRHTKRERQLKRAYRLLKEGKPRAKVEKETGLSLRVLRREGLVQ